MDCKEKILSDDYVDIVVDFPVDILLTEGLDICYIPLGEGYSVVYDNLLTASSRWRGAYQYRFTPKVYGLMEWETAAAGGSAGTGGRLGRRSFFRGVIILPSPLTQRR